MRTTLGRISGRHTSPRWHAAARRTGLGLRSHITRQTIFVGGGMTAWVGTSPYPEGLYGLHGQVMPRGSGDRIMPAA